MLWSAWKPSAQSEWRAGAGAGVSRDLDSVTQVSPTVELTWSRAFGVTRR